jgi:phage anti-repressor protein
MNQIITISPVNIGTKTIKTVNARELHVFLESKQDFSTWIKDRIGKYDFVEGDDYLIHKIVDNTVGGRPTLDYHISTDMAKELSMVERNDKGKEARQYFIECERVAQAVPFATPAVTMHPAEAAIFAIARFYKPLKDAGIGDADAFSMAVDAAYRITGVSMMSPAPVVSRQPVEHEQHQLPLPLTSAQLKKYYSVRELAAMHGVSIHGMNARLTRRRYQGRDRNGQYMVVKGGEKFAKINGNGELLWSKEVLAH